MLCGPIGPFRRLQPVQAVHYPRRFAGGRVVYEHPVVRYRENWNPQLFRGDLVDSRGPWTYEVGVGVNDCDGGRVKLETDLLELIGRAGRAAHIPAILQQENHDKAFTRIKAGLGYGPCLLELIYHVIIDSVQQSQTQSHSGRRR